MNDSLDKIFVRDLLIRGILGVNPDERTNRQDILVNFTMWVDTRAAGKSDNIGDSVNYKTITKAIIKHIERSKPYLIERLVADLVQVCFVGRGSAKESIPIPVWAGAGCRPH